MTTVTLPYGRDYEAPVTYLNAEHTIRSWLLTRDHKRIAILYMISVTVFFFIGAGGATLIRVNLISAGPYASRAARGIGRATAELLAEQGARVLINDLDEDVATETSNQISGDTIVFAGDLTKPDMPEQLTQRVIDEEVEGLLRVAERRATELLTSHREALDRLVNDLLAHETVDGDAVKAALGEIGSGDTVVVLNGDVPLLTAATLTGLVQAHEDSGAAGTIVTMTRQITVRPGAETRVELFRLAQVDFGLKGGSGK